ncbi:MAG: type I secretion C-terminal target domain-containing protein, partial [Gammaproteobacteria bacterium]|nr:type I secretion C-terminal target domain-containing protein [Gammaproteobacteria bacterium]
AGVTFNFQLSNPPQAGSTASLTVNVGGTEYTVAVDAAGQGTLFIDTQDSDVYQDASSLTATVTGITGGNFEATDVTGGSATVTVADTLDTVTATLSVNSNSATEGDEIAYTVTLTGPDGMDLSQHGGLSFTLANGEKVTIANGEISGTSAPVDTSGQTNIDNSIKNVVGNEEYEELITAGNTSVSVNHAPVSTSANAEGLEDSSGIEVKLSATDADGSVQSFIINSLPENGTLYLGDQVVTEGMEISADGKGELTLTFVPTKDWSGDTSFDYQAVDNAGAQSDNTSLNIKVQPVTDVPKVTVELGEPEGYNQKVNISNINLEGKSFTITAVKDGSEGTLAHVGFEKEGDVNGFGVGGKASNNNGDAREIDSSEKIVIEFKEPVTDLAVKFSWLATNEYAKYTVYDTAGNVIGSEIVRGINDKIHPNLNISDKFPGQLIGRIEFTSAAKDDVYVDSQGNEQVIAHNNSDYVVHEVTYTVPDTKTYPLDITATPTDIDGSEEITSIIVKVPDGVELSHGTLIETRDGISSWELSLTSSQGYTVSQGENGAITISGVTITAGANDEFEVTVTATAQDGAADEKSASVTISGSAESDGEGATPDITGLGIEGGDLVLDESHLASGTQADAESLTQSGSFEVAASQGVKSLTIGGQVVINDGVFNATTITSPLGNTLTITGYDSETGVIEYSYTLNKSNDHAQGEDDALFEEFDVQLEQSGGGSANASLSVRIDDDAPTLTFTNAVSASSVINGFWSAETGADTLPGLEMIKQIALDGVTVGNGAVVEDSLLFSESNVDGVYQGSFSYNADEGGVKDITFTLTLNEDGSYQIELSAVPVTISITPDEMYDGVEAGSPVEIYYFKNADDEITAQLSVAPEGQIRTLYGMNNESFTAKTVGSLVKPSNDGIGIHNNHLQSTYSKKEGLTTESLIFNPTNGASAISLGFKETGEPAFGVVSRDVLYLTVTGTNGSTQTIMLDSDYGDFMVGADGSLTKIEDSSTGGPLAGYTVDNPFDAGEAIDHLQVTAGFYYDSKNQLCTTKVKIDFGFSTELEQTLPLPVEMDFTATVTDADGDTTNSSFTAGMQASGPIEGTDGDDAITGTEGSDELSGAAGNDQLSGGAGSDWLAGGLGDDIIDLGAGDGAMDIVYWSAEEAQPEQSQSDTVTSFELGTDKLDLSDFLTDDEQNDLGAHLSAVGDGDNTVVKVTSDSGAELNITLDGVGYDADILSQILVDELVSKLPDNG